MYIFLHYVCHAYHSRIYPPMTLGSNAETPFPQPSSRHLVRVPQERHGRFDVIQKYHLPWEPTTFIFRGYKPYIGGSKPSFFMVLGSKGIHLNKNIEGHSIGGGGGRCFQCFQWLVPSPPPPPPPTTTTVSPPQRYPQPLPPVQVETVGGGSLAINRLQYLVGDVNPSEKYLKAPPRYSIDTSSNGCFSIVMPVSGRVYKSFFVILPGGLTARPWKFAESQEERLVFNPIIFQGRYWTSGV